MVYNPKVDSKEKLNPDPNYWKLLSARTSEELDKVILDLPKESVGQYRFTIIGKRRNIVNREEFKKKLFMCKSIKEIDALYEERVFPLKDEELMIFVEKVKESLPYFRKTYAEEMEEGEGCSDE